MNKVWIPIKSVVQLEALCNAHLSHYILAKLLLHNSDDLYYHLKRCHMNNVEYIWKVSLYCQLPFLGQLDIKYETPIFY